MEENAATYKFKLLSKNSQDNNESILAFHIYNVKLTYKKKNTDDLFSKD